VKRAAKAMARRSSKTHFQKVPSEIAILKKQPDGKIYWVEAAKDVVSAKERVQDLTEYFPGEYVIRNTKTGEEIILTPSTRAPRMGQTSPAVN
jgi:hypothetical protein